MDVRLEDDALAAPPTASVRTLVRVFPVANTYTYMNYVTSYYIK